MVEKQQNVQIPVELKQQINVLNARISNANFARGDLLKEMNNTLGTMVTTIATLQKENTELKTKAEETKKQR